jgi:hypothetical protein
LPLDRIPGRILRKLADEVREAVYRQADDGSEDPAELFDEVFAGVGGKR